MVKLIALLLTVAMSFSVSAGVAPTAPNSALAQSGAKIAAPAKQSAEGKDDKMGHQESTLRDLAK